MKVRIPQLPTEYEITISDKWKEFLEDFPGLISLRNNAIQRELVKEITARLDSEIIEEEEK